MSDPWQPSPRLTRRGRMVLVLFVAVVALLTTGVAAQTSSGAAGDDTAPASHQTIVVQPGDTLWSIARRIDPGGDPRWLIREIEELNELSGGFIESGQRLIVPAR